MAIYVSIFKRRINNVYFIKLGQNKLFCIFALNLIFYARTGGKGSPKTGTPNWRLNSLQPRGYPFNIKDSGRRWVTFNQRYNLEWIFGEGFMDMYSLCARNAHDHSGQGENNLLFFFYFTEKIFLIKYFVVFKVGLPWKILILYLEDV